MNCKSAKSQIALMVGNDLEPAAIDEVRQHISECEGCRRHLSRLTASLEALQAPADAIWSAGDESLWPKVSGRLASASAGEKPHRLNGWAASLAVAAACTAMLWVASRQWQGQGAADFGQPGIQQINEPAPGNVRPRNDFNQGNDFNPDQRPSDDETNIIKLRNQGSPATNVVPVNQPR